MGDDQNVRVQSGVGLGIKIAFGFVLFFMIAVGGTCAACGACAVAGTAIGKKGVEEAKTKRQALAKTDGAQVLISDVTARRDAAGVVRLSGVVTNVTGRTLTHVGVAVLLKGSQSPMELRLPISALSPLKPKDRRGFEGSLSEAAPDANLLHPGVTVDELEFAP